MQPNTHPWEEPLLAMAHEAYPVTGVAVPRLDPQLRERAYAYCRSLTKRHSRSFYLASGLLPREERRAARALYAFCRVSDDIVDKAEGDPRPLLGAWRRQLATPHPSSHDLVAVAWMDTRMGYRIPPRYAEQLLDGVTADLEKTRYATFNELATYCYSVASTVGLMAMYITGFHSEEAIPYAVRLGVALQITNILRDVAEDWHSGRVYLPQDELAAFGLSELDIAGAQCTPRWQAFMRFQIERNRRIYDEALPGIGLLHRRGRLAITAAADVYRAILDDIEDHECDVFSRRSYVSTWGKLRRLPAIWWRSRRLGAQKHGRFGIRATRVPQMP